MPVSTGAWQIRSWIQKTRCHFLVTDVNPNKWPQHTAFCFSWWQTIFWLNCTGRLRNLKEYPRWLLFLVFIHEKGISAKENVFCLWSVPDGQKGTIGSLYWYRQSFNLLRLAAFCCMHLAQRIPRILKTLSPLPPKGFFYFIPPSLMSSDVWALPQNIGRPQQTWVTHRACKFNCISLKTGRENMLWTRTYFKVIPKYHSDCICTWNKERCRGLQAGLNRMHSSAVPELSSSEPPCPYSFTGKKRCCHVSIPWQSPHNRVVFKASRINQNSLTVVLTFAVYISHDVWG